MPNKYNYKITLLAKQDILSAVEYITEQLSNTKAASDLLSKTEQTIKTICEFPYSFADCSYFLISDEHIRHAVIDNYILVYEIVESVKEIRVLRFRYAKMDLTKLNSKN